MNDTVSSQPSQIVFLRSDQATHVNGNTRTFNFRNPVSALKNHRMMVEVLEFECPISYYLIDSNNNALDFSVYGDAVASACSIVLPDGNYDTSTMTTKINALLNGINSDFIMSVAYDSSTLKFTFTTSASGSNSSITEVRMLKTSTIAKILGFHNVTPDTNVSGGTTFTSDGVANLNRTQNIYIKTPNLKLKNMNGRGLEDNTICKVQVEGAAGQMVHYQNNNSDSKFVLDGTNLNGVVVELEDDDGKAINLNKLTYHLTLLFMFIVQENYVPPPSMTERVTELSKFRK